MFLCLSTESLRQLLLVARARSSQQAQPASSGCKAFHNRAVTRLENLQTTWQTDLSVYGRKVRPALR